MPYRNSVKSSFHASRASVLRLNKRKSLDVSRLCTLVPLPLPRNFFFQTCHVRPFRYQ
jgi:hypothetical protein